MNIETLEAKIKAKAKVEVETRWDTLSEEVGAAVKKFLDGSKGYYWSSAYRASQHLQSDKVTGVLKALTSTGKLPAEIWTCTENRIREEIIATMDTLQKVLLVKPEDAVEKADGPKRQEETVAQ